MRALKMQEAAPCCTAGLVEAHVQGENRAAGGDRPGGSMWALYILGVEG